VVVHATVVNTNKEGFCASVGPLKDTIFSPSSEKSEGVVKNSGDLSQIVLDFRISPHKRPSLYQQVSSAKSNLAIPSGPSSPLFLLGSFLPFAVLSMAGTPRAWRIVESVDTTSKCSTLAAASPRIDGNTMGA
jgi:hypothetical protein